MVVELLFRSVTAYTSVDGGSSFNVMLVLPQDHNHLYFIASLFISRFIRT